MKKTLLLLIVFLMATANIYAQIRFKDFNFAWRYYITNDNNYEDATGSCYIQRDDNGTYWLLLIILSNNENKIKNYYIPKNNLLFFKFNNGDIASLKCESIYKKLSTSKSRYCYFKLDSTTIENLKSHELVKMRWEAKEKIIDSNLVKDGLYKDGNFKLSINMAIEKSDKRYNELLRQKKLKNNPLDGF